MSPAGVLVEILILHTQPSHLSFRQRLVTFYYIINRGGESAHFHTTYIINNVHHFSYILNFTPYLRQYYKPVPVYRTSACHTNEAGVCSCDTG